MIPLGSTKFFPLSNFYIYVVKGKCLKVANRQDLENMECIWSEVVDVHSIISVLSGGYHHLKGKYNIDIW